jgi:hypothetical protein
MERSKRGGSSGHWSQRGLVEVPEVGSKRERDVHSMNTAHVRNACTVDL